MNESRSAELRADFLEKWGPATVRPAVQRDLDALIDAVRADSQASAAPPDEGLIAVLSTIKRLRQEMRPHDVRAVLTLGDDLDEAIDYAITLAADTDKPQPTDDEGRFSVNVREARENGYDLVCAECGCGIRDASDLHSGDCSLAADKPGSERETEDGVEP